jgi:hypothetical protein
MDAISYRNKARTKECYFWNIGICKKGPNCNFKQNEEVQPKNPQHPTLNSKDPNLPMFERILSLFEREMDANRSFILKEAEANIRNFIPKEIDTLRLIDANETTPTRRNNRETAPEPRNIPKSNQNRNSPNPKPPPSQKKPKISL